jgi:hypothetical protein
MRGIDAAPGDPPRGHVPGILKNVMETSGMKSLENRCLSISSEPTSKSDLENGIHEVGGSIPPGSTNEYKDLVSISGMHP